jgi:hypothetical protein
MLGIPQEDFILSQTISLRLQIIFLIFSELLRAEIFLGM